VEISNLRSAFLQFMYTLYFDGGIFEKEMLLSTISQYMHHRSSLEFNLSPNDPRICFDNHTEFFPVSMRLLFLNIWLNHTTGLHGKLVSQESIVMSDEKYVVGPVTFISLRHECMEV